MLQSNLLPIEHISRATFLKRGPKDAIVGDRPVLIDWENPSRKRVLTHDDGKTAMLQSNLLPIEHISRATFLKRGPKDAIVGDRPVLIDWEQPFQETEVIARIEECVGDTPVTLFRKLADPGTKSKSHVTKIRLSKFFAADEYRGNQNGFVHRIVTNIKNNPTLINSLLGTNVSSIFDCYKRGNYVNLWINYQGQFGRAHFDELENFNLQIVGKKHFVLSPPGCRNYYVRSLVKGFGHHSDFPDLLKVDLAKYPRFVHEGTKLHSVVVNAGQMLYIPLGWWHQVDPQGRLNINMNFWLRSFKIWRRPYVFADAVYKSALRKVMGRYDYQPEKTTKQVTQ